MSLLDKAAVALCLLVLSCGQILWWRRRDNIAAYIAGGFYFASVFVPVFFTGILDSIDPPVARDYARILAVGALAYLVGLAFGAPHGDRCRRPRVTFDRHFGTETPRRLVKRVRLAAAAALAFLAASFYLLGYVPLLAADRQAAKYGVGAYAAGFARGSLVYHVAQALAVAVVPVMLMILYRHHQRLDLLISVGLLAGLGLTLSRSSVFAGPLLFLVALGVERRWSPTVILAGACLAFVGGTFVNEVLYTAPPSGRPALPARIAASAPDINDHLLFVNGFRLGGSEYVGTKTLTAGLNLTRDKGEFNPSRFAVRTITGLSDVEDVASGGARLPAPLWGFSAYGYVGAAVWAFLSGVATGFGTTLFRRLLTGVQHKPGQALNLVVGNLTYVGTFGVLGSFYFPQRIGVVLVILAAAVGLSSHLRRDLERDSAVAGPVRG